MIKVRGGVGGSTLEVCCLRRFQHRRSAPLPCMHVSHEHRNRYVSVGSSEQLIQLRSEYLGINNTQT